MTNKHKKELFKMVGILNKRISKGITYLDKRFGRNVWLPKINEGLLDLSDGEVCMTGQAFDEHWEGFIAELVKKSVGKTPDQLRDDNQWDKADKAENKAMDKATTYGFFLSDEDTDEEGYSYDVLTRLWFLRISEMKILAGLEISEQPPVAKD